MNRQGIWPDFRDAWIVHDDGDIVVVCKPAGISSQAADPAWPDDVVTRLRAHLGGAYLGVHQRLDRDTSGVLVYARRKEVNGALAGQFEGQSVEKSYVACVQGWPRGRERVTLRDWLVPDQGGVVRIAGRGARAAKEAVTRVEVARRVGDRAMLRLVLETGRTHQARAQLAHAGAPVAGDPLYGGAPAPRLLLHAGAVSLVHPTSGKRARYAADPPPDFDQWLEHGDLGERIYDDPEALSRALQLACERRWALGRFDDGPRATTAFRLVNEEGDALPKLAVDVYDGWLVAQLYGDDGAQGTWADVARRDRILDALHALGFDGVYLKVRPKQANVLVDTRRAELAPASPVRGIAAPDPLSIREEGMPLRVRLGDGLSTGLFLDQRANRRRVRELSAGKAVANLFAYTCAFTVAAALGGAARTVSVDAAPVALERGRENLVHAGLLQSGEHAFVAEDAFAWLARAARRGERFDVVILDPPSYSSTKRRRFVADGDYVDLAAEALAIVAPGGCLLACTNHRGISPGRFRRILFDAARKAGRDVTQLKDLPEPHDFPVPIRGSAHTKSALLRL